MTVALGDEHAELREAAREAVARQDWRAAARAALDGMPLPDGWPVAVEAGWPGVLSDAEVGGAGLGPFEAMLVMVELGRQLASVGLLGHLPAVRLVARAPGADRELPAELASGRRRAAAVLVPPTGWEGFPADTSAGGSRAGIPRVDDSGVVTGKAEWVLDAPDADLLVVACGGDAGRARVALVPSPEARIEPVAAYDGSRRIGHVTFDSVAATVLESSAAGVADAWFLAQALLGAEAIGAVEFLLERSVAHARARTAFGRSIGSFQAVKHQLVEILRRLENARSLMLAVDRLGADRNGDLHTAAAALRFVAGDALDFAAQAAIAVHGGIGVTWEHDLPLYFRRAQLTRRLLGGHAAAADHVGATLLGRSTGAEPGESRL